MKKIIVICIFVLLAVPLMAEMILVKRDNTLLRQGPGAWYEIINTLSTGDQVEKLPSEDDDYGQWLKVKSKNSEGYISIISTQDLPPKKDIFSSMASQTTSTRANRHSVSAGVKGFADRFSKTFKGNSSFVETALSYNINPKEYKRFKKATYKGFSLRKNLKKVKLPDQAKEEFFTEAESGLGLAIASVIAEEGLSQDRDLQNYINYVGLQLVEAFDLTEINFKFFLLNMPNPNAYATPGGIIFISQGMLKLCENEADLALVLAHEITHVAYNHGMKEIIKRKNHITADDRFSELDREIPKEDQDAKAIEEELENDAFQIYETLIEGRLDKYEEEADQVGMIIAARAGYNPLGLLSLLDKIEKYSVKSNNQHYRPEIISQRKIWASQFLKKNSFPKNLFSQQERFKQLVR
ncbi:M48 family metalloprotease [bacterium]|nr:M48 family metalloprotease [bacterium]